MNALDAGAVSNYHLLLNGSPVDLVNGAAYNNLTFTVTLNINGGAALPNGNYTLTVSGALRDTLGAQIGTDFVRHFVVDTGNPAVLAGGVTGLPGGQAILNGGAYFSHFTSFTVAFNEDADDPAGSASADDVTNPLNYLLLRPGPNAAYNTPDCEAFESNGGVPLGDDLRIPAGIVTYDAGTFTASVSVNGGTPLASGEYRLLVCGTTSIVDLAGNPLNGGVDTILNFSIFDPAGNPSTGFAPGRVTLLPGQPDELAYTTLGTLWLEIPSLNVQADITGVPAGNDGWDTTWLGRQVGWLEGTAYPTWQGNTVLTAHGYTADGLPGPFAQLQNLSYGDTIRIHYGGSVYTYAVRSDLRVSPENTYWLTKHEQLDWITLVTCQQYDEKTGQYRYRRIVRAVLLEVHAE
jgi:LPXTG-site transpeptidase (sortase) family protein